MPESDAGREPGEEEVSELTEFSEYDCANDAVELLLDWKKPLACVGDCGIDEGRN